MKGRLALATLIVLIAGVVGTYRAVSGSSRSHDQEADGNAGELSSTPAEEGKPTMPLERERIVQAEGLAADDAGLPLEAAGGMLEGPEVSSSATGFSPERLWIDGFEPLANDLIAGAFTNEKMAELLSELALAIEGVEPELQDDESQKFEIEQEGYGQVVVTLPPYGPGVNVAITSLQPTVGWDHDDSPGCMMELQFDVSPSGVVRYEASVQTSLKHAATSRYFGSEARPAGAVLDVRGGETTWKPILATMVEHQGRPTQRMSIGDAVTASYDPQGEGMRSIGYQLARIRGER